MALYQNSRKHAKQWKFFNYLLFFNIAEEPMVPFFSRRWAIEDSDGILREFTFGVQRVSRSGISFYNFHCGPFVFSWGKIR